MKKNNYLVALFVTAIVVALAVGCSKTDKQEEKNNSVEYTQQQECGFCQISYNDVSDMEKDIIMKYLSSSEKSDGIDYSIIGSIPSIDDTINLVSYCLKRNTSESQYLVITMDDATETIVYNLPTTISRSTSSCYIVEIQKNDENYFGASFIISSSDSTYHVLDGPVCYGPTLGDDILDCFVKAYRACDADPECRVLCGYAPEYCAAAILLACTIHHLKGGAATSQTNNSQTSN
jgi:hypothetical protein